MIYCQTKTLIGMKEDTINCCPGNSGIHWSIWSPRGEVKWAPAKGGLRLNSAHLFSSLQADAEDATRSLNVPVEPEDGKLVLTVLEVRTPLLAFQTSVGDRSSLFSLVQHRAQGFPCHDLSWLSRLTFHHSLTWVKAVANWNACSYI